MPFLDKATRAQMLVQVEDCPACRWPRYRNYCRTCDEFFYTCGCPVPAEGAPHVGHRLYLAGGLAIPDYGLD